MPWSATMPHGSLEPRERTTQLLIRSPRQRGRAASPGPRCKRGDECLRFLNLWEFRRWRKTLERRSEDGMGTGGAVRALIKFRQRQRCAQLDASRLLPLRNRDGSKERFLGGLRPCSLTT